MSIVEKTVTQIPTTKGLGQATDSLLTGDAPLVVRNLVQDRQGRWSKRAGLVPYGYSTQDGSIVFNPRFCFGTRSGLAFVANKLSDGADAGRQLAVMDSSNGIATFRGRFPEFCAKQTSYSGAPFATDTGLTEYSQISPRIVAVKKLSAMVATVQTTTAGAVRVDFSDARTGQAVRSYAINAAAEAVVTAAVSGGSYLHVYTAYGDGTTLYVTVYRFYALALPTETTGPTIVTATTFAAAGTTPRIAVCDGSLATWFTVDDGLGTTRSGAVLQAGAGSSYDPGFAWNGAIATDGTYGYVMSETTMDRFTTAAAVSASMTVAFSFAIAPVPKRLAVNPAGTAMVYLEDAVGNHRYLHATFAFASGGSVSPVPTAVWQKEAGTVRALAWLPSTRRFYALMDRGMFGGFVSPLPVPLVDSEWYAGGGTGRAWIVDAQATPVIVPSTGGPTFAGYTGQLRTVATLETSLVVGALGLDLAGSTLYASHVQAPSRNSAVSVITDLPTDLSTAHAITGSWGTVVTGAAPSYYDGSRQGDVQFPAQPHIVSVSAGAGAVPAGTYSYLAVYRYTDAAGKVLRSETSDVVVINRSVDAAYAISVTMPLVLSRNDAMSVNGTEFSALGKLAVELYRTTKDGKVYYKVSENPATWTLNAGSGANAIFASGAWVATFYDSTLDADLATRQKCYRSPGVTGTSLQREPAPASVHGCVHKDRLVLVAADGSRIMTSSFAVDGEGAWFSPAFQIQVPGGNGRVVAVATMDNRLVVLRERGVFLVDGDGPPENGGNGTEFSPPQQISSLGCVDSQSVVTTDAGVYFRSHRGIELLTRKLSVEPIGDGVLDFTDAYIVSKWSAYDQENDRVLFCVTDARSYIGNNGATATVLCWDQSFKCWSELRYFSYGRTLATGAVHAPEYACSAQLDIYGNSSKYSVFGVDYQYYICQFVASVGHDFATGYIPTKWQGAWRFNGGPDGRQRIYDWQVIGKAHSPCTVTLSLDYDFSDAAPQTRAFTDTEVTSVPGSNAEARRLVIQPNNQASESMRLTIQDTAPTVGAVGTGRGWSFYGIALEGGPKAGVTKIAKEGKS
jgi:hypothetical protein